MRNWWKLLVAPRVQISEMDRLGQSAINETSFRGSALSLSLRYGKLYRRSDETGFESSTACLAAQRQTLSKQRYATLLYSCDGGQTVLDMFDLERLDERQTM